MNAVPMQAFDFDGSTIRVVTCNGQPWWVMVDLARALGIKKSRHLATRVDAEDRALVDLQNAQIKLQGVSLKATPPSDVEDAPDLFGNAVQAVNESGLYTILLRSDAAMKPGTLAYRFRRWVTAEVLPTIRQTGGYGRAAVVRRDRAWAELRRVADRWARSRNPEVRRLDYARLCELCEELGQVPPPADAPDAGASLLAERFWTAVDAAIAAGVLRNHSHDAQLIAFRPAEINAAFAALQVDLVVNATLRASLTTGPRVFDKLGSIASTVRRQTTHCWVFRRTEPALLPAA